MKAFKHRCSSLPLPHAGASELCCRVFLRYFPRVMAILVSASAISGSVMPAWFRGAKTKTGLVTDLPDTRLAVYIAAQGHSGRYYATALADNLRLLRNRHSAISGGVSPASTPPLSALTLTLVSAASGRLGYTGR